MKAVVVDKDYGSVTAEELAEIQNAYQKAGIDLVLNHFTTEEEIVQGAQGAIAILGTGNPLITRRVMEALPDLKFVQRFGVGVNSIDLDAAVDCEKIILNIPGFCAKELADLATAMILGLARNTVYYDRESRKGNWPKCQYFLPPDVRNMTLGLFGFGAAGQNLYKIFQGGFGTKVIACDPYLPKIVQKQFPDVKFVTFEELITESDIVSIHVGLTEETRHVFSKEEFRKTKSTAMVINTARGPIIDQEALVWALSTGEIQYAGLDTLEAEPIAKDDPLLQLDNVILNPHSGSYGIGAKRTQIQAVCTLLPQAVTEHTVPARNVANKGVLGKDVGYSFI